MILIKEFTTKFLCTEFYLKMAITVNGTNG